MRDFSRQIICILIAAGMLILSLPACVFDCYAAAETNTRDVSVAYFYDKSYFGDNYDKGVKSGFGYEYLQQ